MRKTCNDICSECGELIKTKSRSTNIYDTDRGHVVLMVHRRCLAMYYAKVGDITHEQAKCFALEWAEKKKGEDNYEISNSVVMGGLFSWAQGAVDG